MRGTGVFVNIGKTLIFYDRQDVNNRFKLFCNRPPFCEPQGDRYWCQKALSEGYDSIQVVNANQNENHELVICSGKCSTEPFDNNCPPIETRTGYNATKPCNCVEGTPIVNCNNSITTNVCDFTVLRERHGKNHDEYWDCNVKNHQYKRKTCALVSGNNNHANNSYNVSLIFSTNLHDHYYPKISSFFKQLKSESPNTIMIEMGDLSFGTHLMHKLGPMRMIDLLVISGFSVLFINNNNNYKLEKDIGNKLTVISNIPGTVVSTTIDTTNDNNINGVVIGIMAYGHIKDNNDSYINTLIDHIKDEALCLKKTTNIIILLSHGGLLLDKIIREKTVGYIDIIVGHTLHDVSSCQNYYHNEYIPIIHGSFNKNITGIIHIHNDNNNDIYIQSDMITLDHFDDDINITNWLNS